MGGYSALVYGGIYFYDINEKELFDSDYPKGQNWDSMVKEIANCRNTAQIVETGPDDIPGLTFPANTTDMYYGMEKEIITSLNIAYDWGYLPRDGSLTLISCDYDHSMDVYWVDKDGTVKFSRPDFEQSTINTIIIWDPLIRKSIMNDSIDICFTKLGLSLDIKKKIKSKLGSLQKN